MTEYILTEEEKEKLIRKYNGRSFKDLRPDLAEQWHPTKNGDLTPEMVSEYSNREVYWLLSYDDPVTGAHF